MEGQQALGALSAHGPAHNLIGAARIFKGIGRLRLYKIVIRHDGGKIVLRIEFLHDLVAPGNAAPVIDQQAGHGNLADHAGGSARVFRKHLVHAGKLLFFMSGDDRPGNHRHKNRKPRGHTRNKVAVGRKAVCKIEQRDQQGQEDRYGNEHTLRFFHLGPPGPVCGGFCRYRSIISAFSRMRNTCSKQPIMIKTDCMPIISRKPDAR